MSQSPDSRETEDNARLSVLVVDDEPTLRLGFAYALSNRNSLVETAPNGRAALERIAAGRFDIIILDLRMPDLDGAGVIEELRASGNRIPVVLCSAALSPNAALRAIREGVVDFLLKPVRPTDLRDVIEFVLRPEKKAALPPALRAARGGDMAEAIRLLEKIPQPDRQAMAWLGVLKCIRDAEEDGDTRALENTIASSLSVLAFNSHPLS